MQPTAWWVLQGMTLTVLAVSTGLAFASSGRIGRHTPYGGFLFVISLGYWFVTTGTATYVASVAVDAWRGPPGWGDAFTLTGWALLVLSFYLLLLAFPRPGASPRRARLLAVTIPLLIGLLFGGGAFYRVGGVEGGLEGGVRTAYLFLDGLLVGAFVMSAGVLVRLRRATLGQLYIFLGIALLAKSLADTFFLLWPRDPPLGLFTTALYPLAGAIALIGLVRHHHAVAPLRERKALADPRTLEPQLVLRDAAWRMRGLAGGLGEHLVLGSGHRALEGAGYSATIRDGTVVAVASPDAWADALQAARRRTTAVLGAPADRIFAETLEAYGLAGPGRTGPWR